MFMWIQIANAIAAEEDRLISSMEIGVIYRKVLADY